MSADPTLHSAPSPLVERDPKEHPPEAKRTFNLTYHRKVPAHAPEKRMLSGEAWLISLTVDQILMDPAVTRVNIELDPEEVEKAREMLLTAERRHDPSLNLAA